MIKNYSYIENLSHVSIETFLKLNNWIEKETHMTSLPYKMYYYNDFKNSVLLPKTKNIEDKSYIVLIEQLLDILSINLQKPKELIVDEILNIDKEVIYIRYKGQLTKNYNIPANVLDALLENSRKMFMSSYADAHSKELKVYRRGQYPNEIKEIGSQIEFGQTSKGSYILPMYIPSKERLEKVLHPTNLFDELADTTEDKVSVAINKLIRSIDVANETVKSNANIEKLIDTNNPDFVSVDFLQAMSNIGESDKNNLSVEFIASPLADKQKRKQSTVKKQYTHRIKTFVDEYKINRPDDNEFIGRFYELKIDEPAVYDREKVVLQLQGLPSEANADTDKTQKIICEFTDEEYRVSVFDVMKLGKMVRVKGTRDGKRLLNCSYEIL